MAQTLGINSGIFRSRAPGVGVELKGGVPAVYVYEDENLRLEIPVPPLEVFLSFVRELDKLGAEDADVEKYLTTLARAFWLLHQRPRLKGLFRKKYVIPEVDDEVARKLLNSKVRRCDVAVKSLPPALFGLVEYCVGVHVKRKGEAGCPE
jgi:hypothetical protein